ncbi:hypothetical protein [Mycobacterium sp.]|uniref:hypothetical protein n=1 Tax=Mycobacterium sp. TaxID=1785 RepID=UPI003F9E69FB
MAHINAVVFCELSERLASFLLVKNALARVANVTTTIRGGEVSFLLTSTDRLKNLRYFHRRGLTRLKDLINFLIVAIRYTREVISEVTDATKGSHIRVLFYAILSRYITGKLLAVVEDLNESISSFALLNCKRPSFGSIQEIRNIVVGICNLTAILDPSVQTCNSHLARPLMTDNQKRPFTAKTSTCLHHLQRSSIVDTTPRAVFFSGSLGSEAKPLSTMT